MALLADLYIICCLSIVDWRNPDEDEAEPKRKMCKEKTQNHFHGKLLDSVVVREDLPSAYEVELLSGPKADKTVVLNKFKEPNGVIMKNKSRGTQYYCLLGSELAKYKLLYYERCDACASKICIPEGPSIKYVTLQGGRGRGSEKV